MSDGERRNPLARAFESETLMNSGDGTLTGWSYTVPAGRRFFLEHAGATTYLEGAFVATGGSLDSSVAFFPLGVSSGTTFCIASPHRNVTGGRADVYMALNIELQATDVVQGLIRDTNPALGGVANHITEMSGTECDA